VAGEAAQRVAADRFHLHRVGTRVDQELAAIAAGDPVTDLHDAQIAQRG
jgi:hypothetical protein